MSVTESTPILPAKTTTRRSGSAVSVGFIFRLVLLTVIIGGIMIADNVNIGSIGQGMALGLVGVGVYITFRVLQFPDLSVDGSFPIGGAIAASLIVTCGISAEWSLLAAFIGGALTGLTTALIHVLFRIEGLLASIIVLTGAYTFTLRIMGTSNIPLLNERTILTPYADPVRTFLVDNFGDHMRRQSNNIVEILVFSVIILVLLLILTWFMHTELGLTLRASGKNSQMVRALGVNDKTMIIIGLMISNGLCGVAGALSVQQLGFADVQMGVGIIVRGLAAVMIGEVLLRPRNIGQALLASTIGMIVFEVSRAWVFARLDLHASDIRLMSALVVLVVLAAPYLIQRWRTWQRQRQMEADNHA